MKRVKTKGKSARRGNQPSTYEKQNKKPYQYSWEQRLANGDLKNKMNQHPNNKYQ